MFYKADVLARSTFVLKVIPYYYLMSRDISCWKNCYNSKTEAVIETKLGTINIRCFKIWRVSQIWSGLSLSCIKNTGFNSAFHQLFKLKIGIKYQNVYGFWWVIKPVITVLFWYCFQGTQIGAKCDESFCENSLFCALICDSLVIPWDTTKKIKHSQLGLLPTKIHKNFEFLGIFSAWKSDWKQITNSFLYIVWKQSVRSGFKVNKIWLPHRI